MGLRVYRLCRLCSEREGSGTLRFEVAGEAECFVCEGMTGSVPKMAELAKRAVRHYEFRTFAVGVSLPDGVQEREDELRSDLRLKGNETIKTQVARLLAAAVATATRKRVDKGRPEVTVLAEFGTESVSVSSRPVFFYGRYAKSPGVAQRRAPCSDCRGSGCKKCRNTGFERKPSVEEAVRKKLGEFAGSDRMVFSWLGSEDRESKVFPPGRPFVAEVKNPKRRKGFPSKFGVRAGKSLVSVSSGRMLPSKPVRLPPFRFLTKIRAATSGTVRQEDLAELGPRFHRTQVIFSRPNNRPAVKTVYRVSAVGRGKALLIDADLDGGLPVKRFVSGDLVSPSVSEVLKTEVGCRSFDICRVKETGEFGFAEVARDKEKN